MRFLNIFLIVLACFSTHLSASPNLGQGRPGDYLYVHHAPDPVNVRNGNFYLPVQDYYLACFGFPLEVYRSYNSISTRNGPFGKGWTFNYDIQIIVGQGKTLKVMEADGFLNEYVPVNETTENRVEVIKKILQTRRKQDIKYYKKPDGKGRAFYKKYAKRLKNEDDFFEKQKKRYLPKETNLPLEGKYVSEKRGRTFITVSKSGYIRTAETGRTEEYNKLGQLVRISDRNENFLKFEHNAQSRLSRVSDSCGQFFRISYSPSGKITTITDSLSRRLSYQYDKNDNLVSSVSLEGEQTRFSYDKRGRMQKLVFSDGVETEITYDKKSGFVTQQKGPGKKITKYKYGKNGKTRWAEVTDNSDGKSRFEYTDSENKIVFIDKDGKKTITIVSECCSKPLSIKDGKGVGEEFSYDKEGKLISKKDASGGITKFTYEPKHNHVSKIKGPDGTEMRFIYDQYGNLTFARTSNKEFIKLIYESHGKVETMTNQKGEKITFSYSRFGKPRKIEKHLKKKFIGSIDVSYDKTGDISKVTYRPKNPETISDIKATLAGFLRILKPSGLDFEI